MAGPIFPEEFYTRILGPKERVGINEEGNFEILPEESSWNYLKRFVSFTQDSDFAKVHDRLKGIFDQVEENGPEFAAAIREIHGKGEEKYNTLERNLCTLRRKLDHVGQVNFFSKVILSITNVFRYIFGWEPIELKTYADYGFRFPIIEFFDCGKPISRSFDCFVSDNPLNRNYTNPLRQGLELTAEDRLNSAFVANTDENTEIVRKLELGLKREHKLNTSSIGFQNQAWARQPLFGPRNPLEHRKWDANLTLIFDPASQRYQVKITNGGMSEGGWRIWTWDRDNEEVYKQQNRAWVEFIDQLNVEQKSFHFFVVAEDGQEHDLEWTLAPSADDDSVFADPTAVFTLEPGVEYSLYTESRDLIDTLRISPAH